MKPSLPITSGAIALFLMLAGLLIASTTHAERVPATNEKGGVSVIIPEHAVQVADNVFSLGSSVDPESGKKVEGFMIVHPKTNGKKPSGTPGGGGGGDTGSSCYGFLASGAKWKTVEPWVVDPANSEGLSEAEVFALMDGAVRKWEDAANGAVDGNGMNIFGEGSTGSGFAESGVMDGTNGVRFGALDNNGTIAVTTVWGIFGGRPQNRELVEWDQVYNTFYSWATNGASSSMDFDSIATHETGHSFGMADLYQPECSNETMYGYGSNGDTKARDLNTGDIIGISTLY